jgi:hypothetical protein
MSRLFALAGLGLAAGLLMASPAFALIGATGSAQSPAVSTAPFALALVAQPPTNLPAVPVTPVDEQSPPTTRPAPPSMSPGAPPQSPQEIVPVLAKVGGLVHRAAVPVSGKGLETPAAVSESPVARAAAPADGAAETGSLGAHPGTEASRLLIAPTRGPFEASRRHPAGSSGAARLTHERSPLQASVAVREPALAAAPAEAGQARSAGPEGASFAFSAPSRHALGASAASRDSLLGDVSPRASGATLLLMLLLAGAIAAIVLVTGGTGRRLRAREMRRRIAGGLHHR